MSTEIWINIGSGNGLLPDGTKPLPEPMLTDHQWSPATFILGQFHKRCLNHQLLKSVWKLHVLRFHSHFPGANELNSQITPIPHLDGLLIGCLLGVCYKKIDSWINKTVTHLTHCGLVMPNGNIDKSVSTLAQIMACCLKALNHYLNQCLVGYGSAPKAHFFSIT